MSNQVGSWSERFVRTCSDRVQEAIKRSVESKPGFCLEHARAEMKAYEMYKDEPRIIQQARLYEIYLRDKTIYIQPGELLVGNVVSGNRFSQIKGELYYKLLTAELDDPVKDYNIRGFDEYDVSPEVKKELKEEILPYFKDRCFEDRVYPNVDEDVKQHDYIDYFTRCFHMPNFGNTLTARDSGHQTHNYEKVLLKGLKGIREEVEWYKAQIEQSYSRIKKQERLDFHEACLISFDAAIAYAQRYADLAREMAAKETDVKRKKELEEIAEICERVPANPARNWREAMQALFFTHVLVYCEVVNAANGYGRFDQYMYPFYKKSVIDEKSMTRDEALELVELFLVKINEHTELHSFEATQTLMGFPMAMQMNIGGQDKDGKDAVNEVSWLVLDAEEQAGLREPDIGVRIFEDTPDEFIKRVCEVIRLGRGKPKFFFDKTAIQMVSKIYPDYSIEDVRQYVISGCTEMYLPYVTMLHSFSGMTNMAKVLELVLNNGKCRFCGEQIGPLTGDPRKFESMENLKEAFSKQAKFWIEYLCRGIVPQIEAQAKNNYAAFASCLLEGPLQKGVDLIEGGCFHTHYGYIVAGLADVADSLSVIDKLIYRDKKITWEQLLTALENDWEGYDELRNMAINGVPKYGNDDEYADSFATFVMNTWCNHFDWVNTQKDMIPSIGGKHVVSSAIVSVPLGFGFATAALPNGRKGGVPLADTSAPTQGMDKKGPTAVIKSVSKLPLERLSMGSALNQRLSTQLVATDEDLDRLVAFIKAAQEMGLYEIQLNIISANLLRKAMKEPENYRSLLVRVASYTAYFVELSEAMQLDIINRTEQISW
ncbi:MAG TPA: pyruvate formate lyase family protein [Desulfitobacteriaceae bacterium]|nr:pyruvate formate lyase family protein [Desulfitobacteriaceae bacterium]